MSYNPRLLFAIIAGIVILCIGAILGAQLVAFVITLLGLAKEHSH